MVVVKAPDARAMASQNATIPGAAPAQIGGISFFPEHSTPPRGVALSTELSTESDETGRLYLDVLDNDGDVLYSQPFKLLEYIQVPVARPGESDALPPIVKMPEPEAVLFLPELPGAVVLRVRSLSGTSEPVAIPTSMRPAPTSAPPPSPSSEKVFDVLILASGFSDITRFQNQAAAIRTLLESQEPFASRLQSIEIRAFENTTDLGCYSGCSNIERLMCCDSSKVMEAAATSSLPFDEILVVHDTETYSGGGYRDMGDYMYNSAGSYAMVYSGYWTTNMALHEFGHSFGNLCDEYTYGSEGYSYNDCVNCQATCDAWSAITPVCTQSCDARSSYFRPEDSIMLTLSIASFNAASIRLGLEPRLNFFADKKSLTNNLPGLLFQLLEN